MHHSKTAPSHWIKHKPRIHYTLFIELGDNTLYFVAQTLGTLWLTEKLFNAALAVS